jgi:hypothetical protein
MSEALKEKDKIIEQLELLLRKKEAEQNQSNVSRSKINGG